jgi:hypothetical protein
VAKPVADVLKSEEDEKKMRKYKDACAASMGGSFTPFVLVTADGVVYWRLRLTSL